MKNLITKPLLALLLIVSFLSINSCKKDKTDENTTPKTKTELLTASAWIMTANTVSPAVNIGGTMVTDVFAQMESCSKDDLYKFNATGTYTFEEGATKCVGTDPQVWDSGTWVFNTDETKVLTTTTGSPTPEEVNLIELTATTLKITNTQVDGGVTYTYTQTFSH